MKRFAPKSEFSRNVLTLMTGTTIAQAVPVAISPILTRLYTPAEFGVFALFVSITSIFAAIANGRYELAIMLPDEDSDALNIAALGLCIAAALSLALLVVVALFGESIARGLGSADIRYWLYLMPFTVFFMGLYNVLNYYSSRKKRFSDVAEANVTKAVVLAATQVVLGLLKFGAGGLVAGQVASSVGANAKLIRNIKQDIRLSGVISTGAIKRNASEYRDFPKFSLWGILANTLSINIGSILISRFFFASALGQYALMQRVMALPATLIAGAIGQVFYQQASQEMRSSGTALKAFRRTLAKLALISIPVFGVAYFVVEYAFVLVFGEPWREAGLYAQALVPLFAVRFVVSPLSTMNQVYLKNRIGMYANFAILGITVAVLTAGGMAGLPLLDILHVLAAALSAIYLGFLLVIYRYAAGTRGRDEARG